MQGFNHTLLAQLLRPKRCSDLCLDAVNGNDVVTWDGGAVQT